MTKYEDFPIHLNDKLLSPKLIKLLSTAMINTLESTGKFKHINSKCTKPRVVNYKSGLFMKKFATHNVYLESLLQHQELKRLNYRIKKLEHDPRSIKLRFREVR